MNRKPIFDAARSLIFRGFTESEVVRIDRAIDRALGIESPAVTEQLGRLSEKFESGGRGPGAVSSGNGDPGGVSYGIYQLASRTGTARAFVAHEGARWAAYFGRAAPGSAAFSKAWKAIAKREPESFAQAQHDFIQRTHYQPAIDAVLGKSAIDLDSRHRAVRDAVWSVSVQHGGAVRILAAAIADADADLSRTDSAYDRRLIEAIYTQRTQYVQRIASRLGSSERRTLQNVVRNRYPSELRAALAMIA